MVALIEHNQLALEALCRTHRVRRLELFGSAAQGKFDPLQSDLDFLVVFEPLSPAAHADSYFGLLAALQDLFQREVDLVEAEAITNPYFKRALVSSVRQVLYAA